MQGAITRGFAQYYFDFGRICEFSESRIGIIHIFGDEILENGKKTPSLRRVSGGLYQLICFPWVRINFEPRRAEIALLPILYLNDLRSGIPCSDCAALLRNILHGDTLRILRLEKSGSVLRVSNAYLPWRSLCLFRIGGLGGCALASDWSDACCSSCND